MKKWKFYGMTLLLTIGFTFPACEKELLDSCDGVEFKNFFDVQDLTVTSFTDLDNNGIVAPTDTINLAELDKIQVDYIVDYLAVEGPKRKWSFGLVPTANACSYTPGSEGSKEEALVNFSITTSNDFDAEHLAGANINDLFTYHGNYWSVNENVDIVPLSQFLSDQMGMNLEGEDLFLELIKAPELNSEFKINVNMELSTGEIYSFETEPIYILP